MIKSICILYFKTFFFFSLYKYKFDGQDTKSWEISVISQTILIFNFEIMKWYVTNLIEIHIEGHSGTFFCLIDFSIEE
jgi:hypothetical protein